MSLPGIGHNTWEQKKRTYFFSLLMYKDSTGFLKTISRIWTLQSSCIFVFNNFFLTCTTITSDVHELLEELLNKNTVQLIIIDSPSFYFHRWLQEALFVTLSLIECFRVKSIYVLFVSEVRHFLLSQMLIHKELWGLTPWRQKCVSRLIHAFHTQSVCFKNCGNPCRCFFCSVRTINRPNCFVKSFFVVGYRN